MPKISQKGIAPLILIAAIGIVTFLVISSTFSFRNSIFQNLFPKPPSHAATNVNTIYIEAPEKYLGSATDKRYSDGPFNVSINNGQLKGYINSSSGSVPGGATYLFEGTSLSDLHDTGIISLKTNNAFSDETLFDSDGTWITGPAYLSPSGKFVTWYHAEHNPNHGDFQIKSIGYTESNDGGRTFTKPNYPNNQIIRPDPALVAKFDAIAGRKNAGNQAGDFKVIPFPLNGTPQYYYLYYQGSGDSDSLELTFKTYLARATISSDGKPGTWFKYYNGSFNQPGLDGKTTHLKNGSDTWPNAFGLDYGQVVYDQSLGKYIGMSKYVENGSYAGVYFNFSNDGINWEGPESTNFPFLQKIVFPIDGSANSDGTPTQGYTMIYIDPVGTDADPNVVDKDGNGFYLMNDYQLPGSDGSGATGTYVMRRKIHFKQDNNLGELNNFNKIKFDKYSNNRDDWETTGATIYKTNSLGKGIYNQEYQKNQDLGYLLTMQASGDSHPLYSCVFKSNGDHLLTTNKADCNVYGGGSDLQYIERIGYTVPSTSPGARLIFRCNDPSKTDHFVSLNSSCDGRGNMEFSLGNTLFPNLAPTVTPTPAPPTPTPVPTQALLTVNTPTLSCTLTTPGLNVSWSAVSGATEYQIFRIGGGSSPSGYGVISVASPTTSYHDQGVSPLGAPAVTPGNDYSYRIVALNGTTPIATGTSNWIFHIPACSPVQLSQSGNNINFSWSANSSSTIHDWMGIFQNSSTDNQYITWVYTNSCTRAAGTGSLSNGSCLVPITGTDHTGATYNLAGKQINTRYFTNDSFNRLGTSNVITVVVSAPTPTPTATPHITPTSNPSSTPNATPKPGDINGDGLVNVIDYGIFVGDFPSQNLRSDIDHDGHVTVIDYGIFVGNFGR